MEENTFQVLIENYEDFEYYSMDTDRQIDNLTAYGYAGHTVLHSRMLSGTGSGSSEGSVDTGPPPLVDKQPHETEKPLDLDKMVMMTDTPPVTPQAGQKVTPAEEMPPNSEKKKKTKKKKKSKGEGVAGMSASTPKKTGPKVITLQQALDEIVLREQLDE